MPLREQSFQRVDVAVRVDVRFGPRQPAAVDEAGVVLRVGVDRVAAIDQRRHDPRVGGESGGEEQGGLDSLEHGEPPFEFFVDFRSAADERA